MQATRTRLNSSIGFANNVPVKVTSFRPYLLMRLSVIHTSYTPVSRTSPVAHPDCTP